MLLLLTAWLAETAPVVAFEAPATANLDLSLARAEQHLSSSRPELALAEARRSLARIADDPRLLDLASRAAEAAGDLDLAIVYARHAMDVLGRRAHDPAEFRRLAARIRSLDPLAGRATAALDQHVDAVFALAEYARRNKLYANAVDLYTRLERTRLAGEATRRLERMLEDPRLVDALALNDLRILLPFSPSGLSEQEVARRDFRHQDWESAERIVGPNYVVRSNAGHEKAVAVSQALEQMNAFYRDFFAPLELRHVGRSCEVRLYRTREQYQRFEKISDSSIEAFFDPRANYVATFDPTSVGLPFSDLWDTLFHEASHQFTDRISYTLIPGWIHEGTSAYFEGATLLPGGAVRAHGVAGRRLRDLLDVLDRGKPTFREVVGYTRAQSYPRSYYSTGWGLVYFLWNYEDENAQPVYRKHYVDFLRSYRSPIRLKPLARFERHFVQAPAHPGIESLDDFVIHFASWIRSLAALSEGGTDTADQLLGQARLQRKNGRADAARRTLQWALRKRPDDIDSQFELARVMQQAGHVDGAILAYRRTLERIRVRDSKLRPTALRTDTDTSIPTEAACLAAIRELSRTTADRLSFDESGVVREVGEGIAELRKKGFDGFARIVLGDAVAVLGPRQGLAASRADLTDSARGLRRWRVLDTTQRLRDWSGVAGDAWTTVDGRTVRGQSTVRRTLLHRRLPVLPFRFEATFSVAEDTPLPQAVGLVFGATFESGLHRMWMDRSGTVWIGAPERGPQRLEKLAVLSESLRRRVTLAVEVDADGTIRYFADDAEIGSRLQPPSAVAGHVGLLIEGGAASFADLRTRY